MNRRLMQALLCWVLLASGLSSGLAAADPLTPEQAGRDLKILKRALIELHPGLYRYRSPEQIEAEFVRAEAQVAKGATRAEMFLAVTRLATAVRCGHTWTNPLNQSEPVRTELFDRADKLPLRLAQIDRRWLVTHSADAAVLAGDELLAIDGRSAGLLVDELMPYLRADGSSDGKRLSQLDTGSNGGAMDRLFPLLHPPVGARYVLRIRDRTGRVGERSVAAVTVADRERRLAEAGFPVPDESWHFSIDGATAVLTLPTFAFWRDGFDWRGFLNRSFAELELRAVPNLIIDLRRNEGGDSAIGEALLAHLLHAPFSVEGSDAEVAYERVPYALARYLDTWDFDFFDRTGQVGATQGRNRPLLSARVADRTLLPAEPTYRGRAIALVGPQMSSAGFIIARDLQRSHAAQLIGQPTGGNLRGLNGGQLAWVTLPNSGIAVDIPLIAWMPRRPAPDASVTPDIVVPVSFDRVAAGEDPEMAEARRLIDGG